MRRFMRSALAAAGVAAVSLAGLTTGADDASATKAPASKAKAAAPGAPPSEADQQKSAAAATRQAYDAGVKSYSAGKFQPAVDQLSAALRGRRSGQPRDGEGPLCARSGVQKTRQTWPRDFRSDECAVAEERSWSSRSDERHGRTRRSLSHGRSRRRYERGRQGVGCRSEPRACRCQGFSTCRGGASCNASARCCSSRCKVQIHEDGSGRASCSCCSTRRSDTPIA